MMNVSLPLLALAAALAAPASAQYGAAPLNDADQLAAEMRVIGANPTDVVALTQAGELSTRLGDLSGAASLFARADKVDPRNGRVKAGMADVLLHLERPGEALQYYNQAEGYGYPVARFASERGLAYDLVAQQGRAQRDYRAALASGAGDDETVRRYALSLGISGQREAALQQLEPLLRRNDRGAWRARAFVLAMTGDAAGAQKIATTMMAPGQASGMATFFARLPAMGPADRAFAVQFGEVRPTPQRLADLRLAPALPALAPELVAVARAAPPVQVAAVRVDKRKRPRKGEVQLAAATPALAAPALPSPPAYGVATQPVAVAALAPRALPPASFTPRAPVASGYAIPQASRVLPARSPLPPPPVLVRQVAPTPAAPVAVARATPPVVSAPVAQVALAQAVPPRGDRFVPYARPGSLLPGYVRVGGAPSSAIAASGPTPSQARVTGTLSAPMPTVVSASPPRAVASAAVSVPAQGAPLPTTPVVTAVPLSPIRPATAPVALASAAPEPVMPRMATPSPVVRAGTGSPDVATATSLPPVVAQPAPLAVLGTAPRPGVESAPAGAVPPALAAARPLGAGFGAGVPTVTASQGVAPAAPGGIGEAPSSGGSGVALASAAPRDTTRAPASGALATGAIPSGPPPVAAVTASGPTIVAGIRPVADGGVLPATTASPSAPATTAGFSPASVGPTSPEPITTGEPAGVAVASAAPVHADGLARIVSALPVPASELNIAAPTPVPVPRRAASTGRQIAALANDVPSRSRAAATTPGARDSGTVDDTRSIGSRRHKAAGTPNDAAPSTRKHGNASTDDNAPTTKVKGRKGTATADEPAPKSRKGASPDDAPSTKSHHAALAKADEDGDAPTHGKHGRHATDDDAKKPTGKKALADKHEAEPQRYWVQVAGGANDASLGKAWSIARAKAPALAGKKGYTTPLRATNRVLAGPFKDDDEARAFVNTLNKQGVHAFQFTSDKGQKVRKLDDE